MQVSRPARLLVLGLAAAGLGACGGDPRNPPAKYRLEGSLGQVMDLGFDEARILVAPEDVSLVFVRIRPLSGGAPSDGGLPDPLASGVSEDYPLKIAWRLVDEQLPEVGARLDLTEPTSSSPTAPQRGTVSRNVANDPRTTFPRLSRGTLRLDRALDPDALVGGDFHLTFENGIEVASGRTAFSTAFTARVQP